MRISFTSLGITSLTIVLTCGLLSACGQRGPLRLPGEQRQEVPAATNGAPATPLASPIPRTASAASTTAPATSAEERENSARRRN
jgi:predicted small lipoprotein YifL